MHLRKKYVKNEIQFGKRTTGYQEITLQFVLTLLNSPKKTLINRFKGKESAVDFKLTACYSL